MTPTENLLASLDNSPRKDWQQLVAVHLQKSYDDGYAEGYKNGSTLKVDPMDQVGEDRALNLSVNQTQDEIDIERGFEVITEIARQFGANALISPNDIVVQTYERVDGSALRIFIKERK